MNPFQELPTAPNLFDQVDPGPADVRKDGSVAREARYAALSTVQSGEALMSQIQDLTAQYNDQIQKNGDDAIRLEAAAAQQTREVESVLSLVHQTTRFDDEVMKGAGLAAQKALAEDIDRRKSYALEQQAMDQIQNMAAAGDYTQAKLLLNNLEGDSEYRIRDINTKRMILQREIERAGVAKESQNWFFDATDFLVSVIPFQESMSKSGLVDIDKGLKNWYDKIFAGTRLRDESAGLWNMPSADFAKYVKDELIPNINEKSTLLGYHSKSEELDLLTAMSQTPSALSTNVRAGIDVVGVVPFGKIAKVAEIPSMMAALGARKEAQSLVAQAALQMSTEGAESAAAKTGVTATEVTSHLTPTAVNPTPLEPTLVGGANEALERGRTMLDRMISLTATERLQPDELERAMNGLEKQLAKEFDRPIKDVNWSTTQTADGSTVRSVEFLLGKGSGDGFAADKYARRYANSLGYQTADIVQGSGGQWFVKLAKDMPEYGYFTNVLNVKASNHLSRRILNARMLSDEFLANMAQVSGNKRNKILKSLSEEFQAPFRALKGDERQALSQILAAGENEAKWFDEDQLNILMNRGYGRDIRPHEIKAYNTARDINDVEYALRNDEAYKAKLVRGFETVSFDTKIGQVDNANALVDRDLSKLEGTGRAFNVTEGVHYNSGNRPDIERLRSQGYMAISVESPVQLADGTTVKTFIMRGSDANIKPLSRQQVAYRAGGHRMYQGKYFVKQTVKGVQPDTLEEFYANPNTYIVAETPAEAKFWADSMEEARLAYKDGKGPSEIDEIFKGHAGFPSGDKFIEDMERGLYDKDHSFVVKFDREMPDEYIQSGRVDNLADASEAGYDGWLRTTGRMYYSRKGEALKDFQGSLAPTLDPFKTIDKAMMNIANITSFSDYKLSAVERWLNTFGKYTNIREIDPSNLTQFAEAKFAKHDQRIVQAGEAQREIIQRNIGWKTELDLQSEQYARNFVSWVNGDSADGLRNQAAKVTMSWWDSKSPLESLRGMAFDFKLGLFNVAQLPLQMGTAVAATLLNPTHGLRGFAVGPFLRHYLTKAGTDDALNAYISRGVHDLTGLEAGEFKSMMKSAKQSGFFDIGGTHQLVGQHGPNSVAGSAILASDGPVRTAGRFFFNEGEIANRAVAWRIAWGEAVEKFPKELDRAGAEFQRYVAGRAEQYAFNMSEQSAAWWQRGALSIPTQFWAYNARMLEALVGKEFTDPQKARLFVGQSILYGSAGLPVAPWITEEIKKHNAPTTDMGTSSLESWFGRFDRGLLDTAIYEMTGVDAQVGRRYGTGGWLADTVKDIMGWSSFEKKSFGDIVAGATFGIMGDTAKSLADLAHYALAESGSDIEGMPMTKEALTRTASNITTISNVLKAYMVFNYGTLISNKGTTLVSDLPPEQAFATMLSFQPGEQDQISSMMAYRKDRSKAVDEAARVIGNFRTRMVNEPDNRAEIMQQVNIFTKLLPPDIRRDALKKAHNRTSRSLYEGLSQQIEKEKVQRAMEKQVGSPN